MYYYCPFIFLRGLPSVKNMCTNSIPNEYVVLITPAATPSVLSDKKVYKISGGGCCPFQLSPPKEMLLLPESVLFVGDWVVTARSSHFRDNGDTNNVILCIIIALKVFVIVIVAFFSGQGQSFIVFFCVILNYSWSPQLSCVLGYT